MTSPAIEQYPRVYGSAAAFPAFTYKEAAEALHAGVTEPLVGAVSPRKIQLCPQNRGHLTTRVALQLAGDFPETEFRLHANVQVAERRGIYDASTYGKSEFIQHFKAVRTLCQALESPVYTLHAGSQQNCTLRQMIDNVRWLQDSMPDTTVGVEGLYPLPAKPQLMDTWDAYQAVYDAGICVALDLSHLNLLPNRPDRDSIVRDWLRRPQTVEIHISDNDGSRDQHRLLNAATPPWWWPLLNDSLPHLPYTTTIFSESNQRENACSPR